VKFPRCSGILLHFTSLPGCFGIGDLGPCAYEFADFLFASGQKLWQVLPLHPTGYCDSPYQCFSAFAGNPLLLSLERLRDRGLLQASDLDLAPAPPFPADFVGYGPVIEFRMAALLRAAQVFFADGSRADRAAFDRFCESASPWLDDFALFMACKDAHHGTVWTSWDAQIRRRDAHAVSEWSRKLAREQPSYAEPWHTL
jgi:4-alpha-glucanotransferase